MDPSFPFYHDPILAPKDRLANMRFVSGDILRRARALLARVGHGCVSTTAYDTAWVGRLRDSDDPRRPAYPQALDWLRANQHPDGSWGGCQEYYHDRVISSLAAMVTLARWGVADGDASRCERACDYVKRSALLLSRDPYETVGFELIIPTLLREVEQVGLPVRSDALSGYAALRQKKLARIPPQMLYSRENPVLYSLEFMADELDRALVGQVQEANGSVGNSPSATAYLVGLGVHDDPRPRDYIASVMRVNSGGAVFSFPLDVFERSWVLYNLDLAGLLDPLRAEAQPHLAYLRDSWRSQGGVSFSRSYSPCDLDDAAITFKTLRQAALRLGDPTYHISLDVFRAYEEADHYRTFVFETDPSLSSNIHLLDALAACLEPEARPMADRVLRFLGRTRQEGAFWFDKWHVSPYYVTAHAVLAAAPFDGELVSDAASWIMATQRADGSWGHFAASTAEETAYCLQALVVYNRAVGGVPAHAMDRAARFLRERLDGDDYPALWIAKTLFAPVNIIRSAIISALALYESAS